MFRGGLAEGEDVPLQPVVRCMVIQEDLSVVLRI